MDELNIAVDDFEGKGQHVDSTIKETDILDASRTLIYAATLKPGDSGELTEFKRVGLIQSFSHSERKELNQIYELGSDQAYLVPGRTSGSISLSRVLLNGRDLMNALYQPDANVSPENFIKSLRDINTPLYIMFVAMSNSNQASKTVTRYNRVFANCQITARQESIGAGQTTIVENMSLAYSSIVDAGIKQV